MVGHLSRGTLKFSDLQLSKRGILSRQSFFTENEPPGKMVGDKITDGNRYCS